MINADVGDYIIIKQVIGGPDCQPKQKCLNLITMQFNLQYNIISNQIK